MALGLYFNALLNDQKEGSVIVIMKICGMTQECGMTQVVLGRGNSSRHRGDGAGLRGSSGTWAGRFRAQKYSAFWEVKQEQ